MAGKRQWTSDLLTSRASSAAEFVRLFDEVTSALTTVCGMVQTADTGQFDSLSPPALSTTTSAVNQLFGYRIFRFNDSLQSVRPIFIRIEFRYSNGATAGPADRYPFFGLQSGTGTDGAGNLIGAGTAYTRPFAFTAMSLNANTAMPLGGYVSLACGGDGFAWLAFKLGSVVSVEASGQPYGPVAAGAKTGMFILAIMRSTDADGAPTSEGFITHFGQTMYVSGNSLYWTSGGNYNMSEVRGTGGITICREFVNAPMLETFPVLNGKANVCRLPIPFAGAPASPFIGVANISALASGDTLQLALVGAALKTYIFMGAPFAASAPFAVNQVRPYLAPFLIWEGADV